MDWDSRRAAPSGVWGSRGMRVLPRTEHWLGGRDSRQMFQALGIQGAEIVPVAVGGRGQGIQGRALEQFRWLGLQGDQGQEGQVHRDRPPWVLTMMARGDSPRFPRAPAGFRGPPDAGPPGCGGCSPLFWTGRLSQITRRTGAPPLCPGVQTNADNGRPGSPGRAHRA